MIENRDSLVFSPTTDSSDRQVGGAFHCDLCVKRTLSRIETKCICQTGPEWVDFSRAYMQPFAVKPRL